MSPLPHPTTATALPIAIAVESLIAKAVADKLHKASQVLSEDDLLIYETALAETELILCEVLALLFKVRASSSMH